MLSVVYLIQYCAVQVLVFPLSLMPLPVSSWLAKRMGDLFYFCAAKRRAVARENLERAYADTLSCRQKERITRKSFQNTALSILELFLIKKIKKNAAKHFVIQGRENLEKALSYGKGAVLITSHLGSWEYLEFLFYLTGLPCSVIVKSVKNPYLDKQIHDLRLATTVIPIPKKKAIRAALAGLEENRVMAIIIDQWDGPEGLWVDFFGSPTSTTSLPARLAHKTSCALVPAYCLRQSPGQYEIHVLPPVVLPEADDWETRVTASLNHALECEIRKYPEQWSWGHRRWKVKPATSRQA